ncbi:hypothetical protein [Paenibacillus sedimenti]|uniref:hypothetical protein n=1 Tax=Paenibacillus sedimenti TaxID=2770274 RepID=UPI00165EC81F|nr:hypothetical protein [Paenibacillus sedimenti]
MKIYLTIFFCIIILLINIGCSNNDADIRSLYATAEGKYTVHIIGEKSEREMATKFTEFWNSDSNIELIETIGLYDSQPKDVKLRKKLKLSEFPTIIICDTKGIVKKAKNLEEVYVYFELVKSTSNK